MQILSTVFVFSCPCLYLVSCHQSLSLIGQNSHTVFLSDDLSTNFDYYYDYIIHRKYSDESAWIYQTADELKGDYYTGTVINYI